jgi:hypothetical protein
MKPIIPFALLGALFAVGAANAASTDPVGYITHEVTGAIAGTPSFTLLSPTLVQSPVYAGVSSGAPSGTTITAASTLPAGIDTLHYVEIVGTGWWSTVVSVSGNTITLGSSLPTGLTASTAFEVKKHNTLKSFLGANQPGFDPGLGLDDADEVQILNGSTQAISSYFYALEADGAPVDGWYDSGGSPADDTIIIPGTSVMAVRKQAGNLTFSSTGEVKTSPTKVNIFVGYNWLAPMRADDVSLLGSNLDTGDTLTGVQRGVDLSVDEVQFIPANQSLVSYFAADPNEAPTGWYDSGGNPSDSVLMEANSGIQLVRKFNGTAVWTVPAVTIAP